MHTYTHTHTLNTQICFVFVEHKGAVTLQQSGPAYGKILYSLVYAEVRSHIVWNCFSFFVSLYSLLFVSCGENFDEM